MSTFYPYGQIHTSQHPTELLQNLIRFDTTNPPGNERECIAYINRLLLEVGIETNLLYLDSSRPSLVARLRGQGNAPPLLLFGHIDVATAENQTWRHPPFEGKLAEGCVWGRGALDMKGGIAMMLAALLRVKAERVVPPGDILLAIVSDEEQFGDLGARYLVENHSYLFDGVRYAISETGGFTFYVGAQRFYPIMVAEKQLCIMEAIVRGPGGHASLPHYGGTMAGLGQAVEKLALRRLPVHVTPVARETVMHLSLALPFPSGLGLRQLLNPSLTDRLLKLLGAKGRAFDPLLHNTVCPTVIRGCERHSVIPSEATITLFGMLLPGYTGNDLVAEVGQIVGDQVELNILRYEPGRPEPDMGLFDTLATILREADPLGVPVPMLLPAYTDARHFARLGIQTYGFLPMNLPADFDFLETPHGPDERIPVEALEFGSQALYKLVQRPRRF